MTHKHRIPVEQTILELPVSEISFLLFCYLNLFLFFKSLQYIEKLKRDKYKPLIDICSIKDHDERASSFNAWIKNDENMKKAYRLAIMSRNGLRERILAYLTMQAAKRGTNTFTIPFSREELAAFLCVNRSALSHELSLMRQEGLLDFHKNNFSLLKLWEGETL